MALNHIHGTIMAIAWFWLTHLSLWAIKFKQIPICQGIHIGINVIICLLIMFGSAIQISKNNFEFTIFGDRYYHNGLGIILMFIIGLLLVSGIMCKVSMVLPSLKPLRVIWLKRFHKILGWGCILSSRIPLYTGWQKFYEYPTIYFILFDLISFSAFFYLSYNSQPISRLLIHCYKRQSFARIIENKSSLDIYGSEYFIFGNLIYPIYQIIGVHPGGYQIINQLRTREIDRFLFGQSSPQMVHEKVLHQHSEHSIFMADQPLAQIKISPLYLEMDKMNKVSIIQINRLHQQSQIYVIYLKSLGIPFRNRGYEEVEQLGRCYRIQADRLNRLYTNINFMHKDNIRRMNKILLGEEEFGSINERQGQSEERMGDSQIPLLIKKYKDGKFTSKYLTISNKASLSLSEPIGFGLSLESFVPGKIVIFAAGTGLYPFSDLIDLLYKTMLIDNRHDLSSQLMINDPILKKNAFKHYEFELVYASHTIKQIHPITLNQIAHLCEGERLQAKFRISQINEDIFMQKYSTIKLTSHKFEDMLQSITQSGFTGILMCGPNAVVKALLGQLNRLGISPKKYRIV